MDNKKHWSAALIPATSRLLDIVVALIGIGCLFPMMLLCLYVSWRATGLQPVFMRFRTGHAGTKFRILKIRTMVPTIKNGKFVDEVTTGCQWMRTSKFDELLQLFQVLIGTMATIGYRPRDLQDATNLHMTDQQAIRWHQMMPGLTGPDALCVGDQKSQRALFGNHVDQLWEAHQGLGRYLTFWLKMVSSTLIQILTKSTVDRHGQLITSSGHEISVHEAA